MPLAKTTITGGIFFWAIAVERFSHMRGAPCWDPPSPWSHTITGKASGVPLRGIGLWKVDQIAHLLPGGHATRRSCNEDCGPLTEASARRQLLDGRPWPRLGSFWAWLSTHEIRTSVATRRTSVKSLFMFVREGSFSVRRKMASLQASASGSLERPSIRRPGSPPSRVASSAPSTRVSVPRFRSCSARILGSRVASSLRQPHAGRPAILRALPSRDQVCLLKLLDQVKHRDMRHLGPQRQLPDRPTFTVKSGGTESSLIPMEPCHQAPRLRSSHPRPTSKPSTSAEFDGAAHRE